MVSIKDITVSVKDIMVSVKGFHVNVKDIMVSVKNITVNVKDIMVSVKCINVNVKDKCNVNVKDKCCVSIWCFSISTFGHAKLCQANFHFWLTTTCGLRNVVRILLTILNLLYLF